MVFIMIFYRETAFTPDDFIKIEERMREIIDRNEKIIREEWNRDQAIDFFKNQGEHFKAELIASIPIMKLTLYRQGNFTDLCHWASFAVNRSYW